MDFQKPRGLMRETRSETCLEIQTATLKEIVMETQMRTQRVIHLEIPTVTPMGSQTLTGLMRAIRLETHSDFHLEIHLD
jgi:hypothetical protein